MENCIKVFILCGGLGTRIRKIIGDIPKSLALIGDNPFLEYLILQLKKQNFTRIVLCTGYMSDKIKGYFGKGDKYGVHITYSEEVEPLGTGGALKLAEKLIEGENFLVINGDTFFDINFWELIKFHLFKKALATLALAEVDNSSRYGSVILNKENRIKGFYEKKDQKETNLINAGIYVLNRRIYHFIPGGKSSFEKEILPKLLGKNIYGKKFDSFFIDIGVPEDYIRLKNNYSHIKKASRQEI